MELHTTFAANVKRFRQQRGLSQTALADKVGMTLQTIFSYESGAKWPRPETMAELAAALKVRPWQLLADENEGGEIPPDVIDLASQLARACGLKVSAGKNS